MATSSTTITVRIVAHQLVDGHTHCIDIWANDDGSSYTVRSLQLGDGGSNAPSVTFHFDSQQQRRRISVDALRDCHARVDDSPDGRRRYLAPVGHGDWELDSDNVAVGTTHRIDLYDYCVPAPEHAVACGHVVLRVDAVTMPDRATSSTATAAAAARSSRATLQALDVRMGEHERDYLAALSPGGATRLRAATPMCCGVHVPTFMTRIGVRVPACYFLAWMPAADYVRRPSWGAQCKQLLRCALHLNDVTEEQFVRAAAAAPSGSSDFCGAVKIVADACTLFANAGVVYADDIVYESDGTRIETERFINVLRTLGGDCEDSTRCAVLFARIMQRGTWDAAVLRAARRVLAHYVVAVATSLAVERSAPGRDAASTGSAQKPLPTHIWGVLVSRDAMQHMTSGSSSNSTAMRHPHVVVLEGTSYQTPLQMPLGDYCDSSSNSAVAAVRRAAAAHVQRRRAFEQRAPSFGTVAIQVKTTQYDATATQLDDAVPTRMMSAFYRNVTTLWAYTSDTDDDAHVEAYTVYDQLSARYGVRFADFVRQAPSVRAKPVLGPLPRDVHRQIVDEVLPRCCPIVSPLEDAPLGASDDEGWQQRLLPDGVRQRLDAIAAAVAEAAAASASDSKKPAATLPLFAHDLRYLSYRFHSAPPSSVQLDELEAAVEEFSAVQHTLLVVSHDVGVLELRLWL
jgi:hypothetical protein